jgi:hypothetical protein
MYKKSMKKQSAGKFRIEVVFAFFTICSREFIKPDKCISETGGRVGSVTLWGWG